MGRLRQSFAPSFLYVPIQGHANQYKSVPNVQGAHLALFLHQKLKVALKSATRRASKPLSQKEMFEGGDRNRTDDKGFADLCLTTWLRRHTKVEGRKAKGES